MKEKRSRFYRFMESVKDKKIFFREWEHGNNGDQLILMGVQRVLRETGCELVDSPEAAEQVLLNGGGWFQDAFPRAFEKIAYYRRQYPSLPLIMAPQVFRVQNVNFKEVCEISNSPFILFARDYFSAESLQQKNLPEHCQIHVSQDPAFELEGGDFIKDLAQASSEKHVLIALRKDEFIANSELSTAKLLARAKGTWLPKRIRRPLSWVRDRMVANVSKDVIARILKEEKVKRELPKIYRDVSVSVGFEKFVTAIRDAALIITDRLHVAVFGHLLGKRVVILCGPGYIREKLKGVYDFNMSGPGSRTSLFIPGECG
jgi:exopolysaccharide biosynthesis predicted pyruvyltransferase EpsI